MRHFTQNPNRNFNKRTIPKIQDNLNIKQSAQIIDARDTRIFSGLIEGKWPGRRPGHIPNSINLPFQILLNSQQKTFIDKQQIQEIVRNKSIDLQKSIITTCGSGITACILALALHIIGYENAAVYDGSWAEWGLPGDTPVSTDENI